MSENSESCLISKLQRYIELNDVSRSQLAAFEENELDYAKHVDVYSRGHDGDALCVVKNGWLYSYTDLPDGRRQIVKIHMPGDIVGFQDIALDYSTTTLRTAEECCLCPFPKSKLDVVFERSPQLTALLFSIAVRDQTILIDMLRAMGRMSAREKIVWLLLELISRVRSNNDDYGNALRLPLNQMEIADCVGLTNVYVSRTLQGLEDDGYIEREGQRIKLVREQALVDMVSFENRYHNIDTSWFPKG